MSQVRPVASEIAKASLSGTQKPRESSRQMEFQMPPFENPYRNVMYSQQQPLPLPVAVQSSPSQQLASVSNSKVLEVVVNPESNDSYMQLAEDVDMAKVKTVTLTDEQLQKPSSSSEHAHQSSTLSQSVRSQKDSQMQYSFAQKAAEQVRQRSQMSKDPTTYVPTQASYDPETLTRVSDIDMEPNSMSEDFQVPKYKPFVAKPVKPEALPPARKPVPVVKPVQVMQQQAKCEQNVKQSRQLVS